MESRWAQQILAQTDGTRRKIEKSNVNGKKTLYILFPIFYCFALWIIIASAKSQHFSPVIPIIIATVALGFFMLIAYAANKHAKSVDLSGLFIKNINNIISQDGVEKFDAEMFGAPIEIFDIDQNRRLYYTNSYVVAKDLYKTQFDEYRVMRKVDAVSLKFFIRKVGVENRYDYDICDINDRSLLSFSIYHKNNALNCEDFIRRAIPNINMASHTLIG